MELSTALRLIEKGVVRAGRGQAWADLGAGNGLFTEALVSLLPSGSVVDAIDKIDVPIQEIACPPGITIREIKLDFVQKFPDWNKLDGVLMANSLHFVSDQAAFMSRLRSVLEPGGRAIVVEYDMDRPNAWVPFPLSRKTLRQLAANAGFSSATELGDEPSRYHRGMIYSMVLSTEREA